MSSKTHKINNLLDRKKQIQHELNTTVKTNVEDLLIELDEIEYMISEQVDG